MTLPSVGCGRRSSICSANRPRTTLAVEASVHEVSPAVEATLSFPAFQFAVRFAAMHFVREWHIGDVSNVR